jgi:hypothetical protein
LGLFIVGVIATLIVLFIWIALIKHFFDCGWLKAIVIGVIAVLMIVVIAIILGLLGIAILTMIWPQNLPLSFLRTQPSKISVSNRRFSPTAG